MNNKTVFISYSHDTAFHSARVLAFAMALRDHGIEVELDQFHEDEIIDWPRWCNEQSSHRRSDFVLCLCTAEYYRRIEGNVPPESGKGVYWEGSLLDDDLYDAKGNLRLVPVLFDDEPETSIPRFLRGWTFCRLRDFTLTDSGYEHALRIFTGQARVVKNPLGAIPTLPQQPMLRSRAAAQGADKYLGQQPQMSPGNPTERPTVIGIEFVADGPVSEFDEAQWEAALRALLGKDVSKVRIASIRKGSTVVRVLGDPEVIAKAFEKLRSSAQTSQDFQVSTRLTSYSGVLSYEPAERIFGRSEELVHLDLAWDDPDTHVLSVIGFGGAGKSHLIAHWLARLAAEGWRGAERVFDWSFYSQGVREQGTVSADSFIAASLVFFGDVSLARSNASPWEKGARLAQLVGEQRTLLVLDGLEPLQHSTGPLAGQLKDPSVAALLQGLAQNNLGLCLLTSRTSVADLAAFRDSTAPDWQLQNLSTLAGVELLRTIGVQGSAAEFHHLVEEVAGHAFTLNLLGRYLVTAHQGDIRRRDQLEFEKSDSENQGAHAFKTLAAYERWLAQSGEKGVRELTVLKLLGLFDRPANFDCIDALRNDPAIPGLTEPLRDMREEEWEQVLSSLANSGLVVIKTAQSTIDAHPLIREYFAKQLFEKNPEAWRLAHSRLYEYLKDSTAEKPQPMLEDLQPLYQAVTHGCQAGMHQEAFGDVYHGRILRGGEFYSWLKLGIFGSDLGAIAYFFDAPWSSITNELSKPTQAFLLNCAAFCLRALGRLTEALEPMRAGLEMLIGQNNWRQAAITASNLTELQLTQGEVAVGAAEQSIGFADRSGDTFWQMVSRAKFADVLHQAGRREDAKEFFNKAEAMQSENQPEYPLLYSVPGFQYCDFLLADPERAAWQLMLDPKSAIRNPQLEACNKVERRMQEVLMWRTLDDSLLDIAHDYLTLGRAALYASILEPSITNRKSAIENLSAAVGGLRRAGTMDELARGLLSHSWMHLLEGDTDAARSDLDEAWQIAERGSMRLFMSDIHLYRARLFHNAKQYPWTSPKEDLADARRLIELCGYWRRKEELEDAEAAAKNW